jgi:LysR family transcriptional activator of nhaA
VGLWREINMTGKAKVGLFVAPSITRTEIMKQYNVREVGCLEGIVEKYYAVSMDRRIRHPAVQAIVDHARYMFFAGWQLTTSDITEVVVFQASGR